MKIKVSPVIGFIFFSNNGTHVLHSGNTHFFWPYVGILVPSESQSRSVLSNSLWPHGLYSLWNSPSQNTGMGSHSLLQGIPIQGSNPGSTLQAYSLPAEPQGKPKNTRVSSLSFFQRIFPTWELYWGFPHCRWILYQLSYQGGSFYCIACWWECKLIAVIMENSMEVP